MFSGRLHEDEDAADTNCCYDSRCSEYGEFSVAANRGDLEGRRASLWRPFSEPSKKEIGRTVFHLLQFSENLGLELAKIIPELPHGS